MKRNLVASKEPQARIVPDVQNATRDYFIPLNHAKELYAQGKLYQLVLGNAYPHSYAPR